MDLLVLLIYYTEMYSTTYMNRRNINFVSIKQVQANNKKWW